MYMYWDFKTGNKYLSIKINVTISILPYISMATENSKCKVRSYIILVYRVNESGYVNFVDHYNLACILLWYCI